MDCNKEEASRAKQLAEEKMIAGDFVGAQKLLTKAQRLFPSLENLPQMIATCDVHSSAAEKIKGLDNWFAILQVQPYADADSIKKQFRKLALLLHPDKNQFAGAEAAFKLVGEAKRLLSDPAKRSQYDIRYRSHSMAASRQSNIASGYTFWTCCKHCGHRCKYLREFMNTAMFCSICRKSYIAFNIGHDGIPPAKQFQDQGKPQQTASTGAEPEISAAEMDKNGTFEGKLNKKNQENRKRGSGDRKPKKDESCTENDTEEGKPLKGETCVNISAEIPTADVLKPQPEVKEEETSSAKSMPDLSALKKNRAAKKRRKTVEEPSKIFEFDSSDVAEAKTDTNECSKRKSSRKKPQVSYADGGDFVSPPTKKTKSGCESESDSNKKQTTDDKKSSELADSGVSPASSHAYKGKAKINVNSVNEDTLSAENKESEGCDGNGEDAILSNKSDKVEKVNEANENPNTLDIPDPEFNVFEAERKTENFAVNQVWSICDSIDGMPRKYARVRKVLNAEFKLRITCLEPVRGKCGESIPVGCGKFKNGKTKVVEERSIFSGQMLHSSGNKTVIIYPRKGEIWALFREWKEEWNTSLTKHKLPYKYDIVEVVNDFSDDLGIGVAYLGKCKGHLSQFHREAQDGVLQNQFCAQEIFRFSHKIPAVKMTEEEKEGVQAYSYKLDTAALPKDISYVDVVDIEMDGDGPSPEAPEVEVKAKPVSETSLSPRKRRKSDVDNGVCSNLGEVEGGTSRSHDSSSSQVDEKKTPNESIKKVFKLRKSPRLQTIPSQERDEKKSGKQGNKMNTPKKTAKGLVTDSLGKRKSPNGIHQPSENQEGESSKKQGRNGELPLLSKENDLATQLDGSTNDSPVMTPGSASCKTPQRNAFDFESQRSQDKLQVNQIWAIYSEDKGMLPTEYVKIQQIGTKPELTLRVTHMELPPSTETMTRPASCGDFKLKRGKPSILPSGRLSQKVNPVPAIEKIVKIYPRKGEVWALYKKCDRTREEYDIVEVVDDYCAGKEIAKAVALTAKDSDSLLYGKQESNAGFIDIPKSEMSRFSHQIPAVRHQKRSTRRVQGVGYWELDPRAIPGRTIVLD
uniref:DnaJ-like protein subfamily B member 14 n=4 Tax=Noccaea caerulescens TaxID=107243 RepID=A0A1J3FAI9_NOCCA